MFAVLDATMPHLPADAPRYLMGVGTPDDLIGAVQRGVDMFDCVIPTRAGRTARAYTSRGVFNLRNARFADDAAPLDPTCACPACTRHSRAYLHHLFRAERDAGADAADLAQCAVLPGPDARPPHRHHRSPAGSFADAAACRLGAGDRHDRRDYAGLTQLGHHVEQPASPAGDAGARANPSHGRHYVVRFTCPEFTSLCPITGQPDFAHIVIDYIPRDWIVESKSLKLYLRRSATTAHSMRHARWRSPKS